MMKKALLFISAVTILAGFTLIQDQLIFASFSIKSTNGVDEISLIQSQVVDGKIKHLKAEEKALQENHLKVSLLNSSNEIVDYTVIDHPLRGSVEYIDENNSYSTTNLNLNETEFFVRMPYTQNISKIRIELIGDDLSLTEINTIILE